MYKIATLFLTLRHTKIGLMFLHVRFMLHEQYKYSQENYWQRQYLDFALLSDTQLPIDKYTMSICNDCYFCAILLELIGCSLLGPNSVRHASKLFIVPFEVLHHFLVRTPNRLLLEELIHGLQRDGLCLWYKEEDKNG